MIPSSSETQKIKKRKTKDSLVNIINLYCTVDGFREKQDFNLACVNDNSERCFTNDSENVSVYSTKAGKQVMLRWARKLQQGRDQQLRPQHWKAPLCIRTKRMWLPGDIVEESETLPYNPN